MRLATISRTSESPSKVTGASSSGPPARRSNRIANRSTPDQDGLATFEEPGFPKIRIDGNDSSTLANRDPKFRRSRFSRPGALPRRLLSNPRFRPPLSKRIRFGRPKMGSQLDVQECFPDRFLSGARGLRPISYYLGGLDNPNSGTCFRQYFDRLAVVGRDGPASAYRDRAGMRLAVVYASGQPHEQIRLLVPVQRRAAVEGGATGRRRDPVWDKEIENRMFGTDFG